jgi:hypothetical protein
VNKKRVSVYQIFSDTVKQIFSQTSILWAIGGFFVFTGESSGMNSWVDEKPMVLNSLRIMCCLARPRHLLAARTPLSVFPCGR